MTRLLVTGGSGFIGAAFLAGHLLRHPDARVLALVRPRPGGPAPGERLRAGLARALHAAHADRDPAELAARVDVLPGDAALPGCGLAAEDRALLGSAGIDQVWHIAADLGTYAETERAAADVQASREVASLAVGIGCGHLVHVSTAYVFGRRAGAISGDEPLPASIDPNNAYETGKLDAEREITRIAREAGMALTVLRPTAVVGHFQTKAPSGSRSGLYGLIRTLEAEVRRRRLSPGGRLVLHGGDGAVNLVSVDRVVDDMLAVANADPPAPSPRIHTIAGTDVPVRDILIAIGDRLGVEMERTDNELAVPAEDRRINRQLAFFRPYADPATRKTFEGGEADGSRRIFDVDLLNYVEAGVREARFGSLTELLGTRRLPRRDGSSITAYETGPDRAGLPTVVIINAFGMPIDAMHPLVHDLVAAGRRVVSWDCRGLPDQGYDVTAGGLTLEDHLTDWEVVRDALAPGPIDLIGWSTGAVVAARVASGDRDRVRHLVLLNGSYMHAGAELTLFQKNLRSIMPKVASSRAIAGLLYKSVFSETKAGLVRLVTRDIVRRSEQAMSVTHPAHKHLVEKLTAGPEEVFRYARLIRAFVQEDPLKGLDAIRCPTLLVTGTQDITAHPKGTVDAAARINGARMHVVEDGDHFSFYTHPATRHVILGALSGVPEALAMPQVALQP